MSNEIRALYSSDTIHSFDIEKAGLLQLNVFSENVIAKKCYESVWFIERKTDVGVFRYKDEMWSRCNMIIKDGKE